MNIEEYEKQQETMVMLKLLDFGNEELKQGKFKYAKDVFDELNASDDDVVKRIK